MKRPWGDGSVRRFHGATGAEGQSLSWAISREHVDSWRVGERKPGEAGSLVPHETVGRGCGDKSNSIKRRREGKKKRPGTSHMKLAVIALRVLIVPVLQRELASVWRNKWSGVPATYSGYIGFEVRLNHKDSHQNRLCLVCAIFSCF